MSTAARVSRFLPILLALSIVAAGPPTADASPNAAPSTQAADEGWAPLGPSGPRSIAAIAVAPSWPAEPLILAARRDERLNSREPDELVRSRDGGATWERLAAPGQRVLALTAAARSDGRAPYFALTGDEELAKETVLSRSTDDGGTWQAVARLPGYEVALKLSPEFARDGQAYLLANGSLQRSDSARWTTDSKSERPRPAPPDRVLDGAAQRFEGGLMLWLSQPDGRGSILLLSQVDERWREFEES